MTSIFFVRHGEVVGGESIRYGRLPGFHLSALGRGQVEQASRWLIRYPIKAIYASPLDRTQQSATIIGMAHPMAPLTLDARLNENKTSQRFEGESRDLPFIYPRATTPDAETAAEIIWRMTNFCRFVSKTHPDQNVVAVSHGDPIALLYNWLVGESQDPSGVLYPGYGSVWRFVFCNQTLESVWSVFPSEAGRLRA